MIKRGNASKRAAAELFSKETEVTGSELNINTEEKIRREKLRREMFGDKAVAADAPEEDAAAEPQPAEKASDKPGAAEGDEPVKAAVIQDAKQETAPVRRKPIRAPRTGTFPKVNPAPAASKAPTGAIPRVHTGTMPRVQTGTMPRAQTGTIPRAHTGTMPRVQTGTIPRAQTGAIPRVQTGAIPRAQTGSIPRVNTNSFPRVGPVPARNTAQYNGKAVTREFTKQASPGRADKTAGNTRKFDRVSQTPEQPKKKYGKKIAAVCAAAALIVVGVISASAIFSHKEEEPLPQPTDVVAGESLALDTFVEPDAAPSDEKGARHTVNFKIYGKPAIVCSTYDVRVGELLDTLGISGDGEIKLSCSEDDVVTDNMEIDVSSVDYTLDYTTEEIPYETERVEDNTIDKGEEVVTTQGAEGVKTYTYRCTIVNGEEVSRELVSEDITAYPVNRVISVGTKEPEPEIPQTVYSGAPSEYKYYVDVTAACYSTVGYTYSGLPTGNNIMAVDPSVIPIGSECIVIGELGDYGYRIAADIGTVVVGNIIDIWVPRDQIFGIQSARVYVLN